MPGRRLPSHPLSQNLAELKRRTWRGGLDGASVTPRPLRDKVAVFQSRQIRMPDECGVSGPYVADDGVIAPPAGAQVGDGILGIVIAEDSNVNLPDQPGSPRTGWGWNYFDWICLAPPRDLTFGQFYGVHDGSSYYTVSGATLEQMQYVWVPCALKDAAPLDPLTSDAQWIDDEHSNRDAYWDEGDWSTIHWTDVAGSTDLTDQDWFGSISVPYPDDRRCIDVRLWAVPSAGSAIVGWIIEDVTDKRVPAGLGEYVAFDNDIKTILNPSADSGPCNGYPDKNGWSSTGWVVWQEV